jgi:hypothetical protein
MMEMLMLSRDKAPDCKPGEKVSFDVSGTVTHADEDHVMIKVDSAEDTGSEGDSRDEGEVAMSPEESAALGKKKKPAAMESY